MAVAAFIILVLAFPVFYLLKIFRGGMKPVLPRASASPSPDVPRMRRIYKSLRTRFQLRLSRDDEKPLGFMKGAIAGHAVAVSLSRYGTGYSYIIGLTMRKHLPAVLLVSKVQVFRNSRLWTRSEKTNSYIVPLESFVPLLTGAQSAEKAREIAAAVQETALAASQFSLWDDNILILISEGKAGPEPVGQAARTALLLAAAVEKARGLDDEIYRMLLADAMQATLISARLFFLYLLLSRYPDKPETRNYFVRAVTDPKNPIPLSGLFSPSALTRENVSFLEELVQDQQTDAQLKLSALEVLLKSSRKRAQDFLSRVFARLTPSEVKLWAIHILKDRSTRTVRDLLAAELRNPDSVIALAAVEGLAVCGNAASVAVLGGLAKDSAVAAVLRSRAQDAVRAIHRRLGLASNGLLSLADDRARQGALSLPLETRPRNSHKKD